MKRKNFVIYIHCVTIFLTMSVSGQDNSYNRERYKMIKTQLQSRGITDNKVLNAFRIVPRHEFVLPEYLRYAYTDQPLPIDEGQTISQPFIVAYMTDALQLKKSDRVLEVGTGSGYQAAILAQLCDSVFTVEIFESLETKASKIFKELKYHNIVCKVGDGYLGWKEKAPFDAIIVTCAPSHIPKPLQDQLADGGRMIIPVGEGQVQHLILMQKQNGKKGQKSVLPVRFVPMLDDEGLKY
ncbi:protein-L-isoaspartate(D-aspartate) O-methyltransferase [Maribellus sp. YY47]|uniref:protein-L-isoaspartate(D-aspartate) O-methyltransferase n=1 Tax=Maribellus sp. YY47 TaxID=2929486 RepID=UPI002000E86B|nr:protein-L-isoaspartate(D-aspartate) O-methyltransferase [Maribellus sp. YY47]MCK3683796.1 protein-L-isoaspartate(D-aspartate) O-methyltransferase [Maribellus sp. YY47]